MNSHLSFPISYQFDLLVQNLYIYNSILIAVFLGINCVIKTTKGNCCVFPFIYKRKSYSACTTADNGNKLWCATTNNYDRDRKWGNCQSTQGKHQSTTQTKYSKACTSAYHFFTLCSAEAFCFFNGCLNLKPLPVI